MASAVWHGIQSRPYALIGFRPVFEATSQPKPSPPTTSPTRSGGSSCPACTCCPRVPASGRTTCVASSTRCGGSSAVGPVEDDVARLPAVAGRKSAAAPLDRRRI